MNTLESTATDQQDSLAVMVVDDNPSMRNSVRRVLLLDGYQVELLGSGRELLAHPELEKFFAIMIDRRLPDADASELVGELRKRAPSAAILIITGYGDMDHAIASMRYDIDGYFVKPVETEMLRTRLNSLAELYRIKRQMRLTQRKLVEAERLAAIGQMVTGLAHESRNALQRARSCLDLLELDLLDQSDQLDLTQRIREALNDLQRNYEEVRNYAAPIVLQLKQVDCLMLLKRAFQDLREEFPRSKRRLLIHGQTSAVTIQADEHRLLPVFRNILEIAMTTPCADSAIEVSFHRRKLDGNIFQEIAIQDSGAGMDDKTIAQFFEPFSTSKEVGTGLGMAICKQIVDSHGGRIVVESEKNKGTIITLMLPVQTRCEGIQ